MALEFLQKHGFDLSKELEKVHFGPSSQAEEPPDEKFTDPAALKLIIGARLPSRPYLWDIHLRDGKISEITPHDFNSPLRKGEPNVLDIRGCLLAPSLCHAHVHLDKCFLLQDDKFRDLQIVKGDFEEAMTLTSKAKARFTRSDLLRRGRQLIVESIQAGVTSMRAFCEVDGIVGLKCLRAGLELKKEFVSKCEIQICAFAQLPLFSGDDDGAKVRELMETAATEAEVEVLGSTPYVEDSPEKELENIRRIVDLALIKRKMLDLHLDYHLEQDTRPLIWDVIKELKERKWMDDHSKPVTLGHCTRMTFFSPQDWSKLRTEIVDLPISFVGLPTSDLFMMRTEENYRGTLPVPELIQEHNLKAALSINNVGNAFTPQGNCDPLSIASLGVGIYSAGTQDHANLLYDCVSARAKDAIGLLGCCLDIKLGDVADFVVFEKSFTKMRTRKSISEVVCDPPSGRLVIKGGTVVSGGRA